MKSAYILHGCCDEEEYFSHEYPSPSNFHWLPWLQKQLLMKGWMCQTPEMPTPYAPQYEQWKAIFDTFTITNETTLIAHSCGGGFFLRWLSETHHTIDKLILVAPWMDPQRSCGEFLNYTIDQGLSEQINEMHIFYSDDEPVEGVKETVDLISTSYPKATTHHFNDKGHFCLGHMGTEEFPEILKLLD